MSTRVGRTATVLAVLLALAGLWPAEAPAQTWTGTWTRKADAPFDARGWIDITYDDLNRRVVLFGGSGASYRNDLRYYNAATDTWTLGEPDVPCVNYIEYDRHTPPTPRDEQAVEYDALHHLYWSFGGSGYGCVNDSRTAGAGTTTSVIVDPALPSSTADFYKDWTVKGTASGGLAFVNAYNPATKTLTLSTPVAGLAPGAAFRLFPQRGGGTFFYDPVTRVWQGLSRHWNYTGQTPQTRLSPALAFAAPHRSILMFGATGSFTAGTWRLDLDSKSWVQLKASGAPGQPPPLYQITNSMVYDRANDVFVLFGGLCEPCSPDTTGQTWVYRFATNTWTNMQPASAPPPRRQHTMVYDTANQVTVLFGGRSPAELNLNDTWVYHYPSNSWSQVSTPVAPSPRRLQGMAYDPVNQVSVISGALDIWHLRLSPP